MLGALQIRIDRPDGRRWRSGSCAPLRASRRCRRTVLRPVEHGARLHDGDAARGRDCFRRRARGGRSRCPCWRSAWASRTWAQRRGSSRSPPHPRSRRGSARRRPAASSARSRESTQVPPRRYSSAIATLAPWLGGDARGAHAARAAANHEQIVVGLRHVGIRICRMSLASRLALRAGVPRA